MACISHQSHIEDSEAIDLASGRLRHQPGIRLPEEVLEPGWLDGVKTVGITAGASTPNNKVGETVVRLCAVAGVDRIDGLTE